MSINPAFGALFNTIDELKAAIPKWTKTGPNGSTVLYIPRAVGYIPMTTEVRFRAHDADRIVAIGFSGDGSVSEWDEILRVVGLVESF